VASGRGHMETRGRFRAEAATEHMQFDESARRHVNVEGFQPRYADGTRQESVSRRFEERSDGSCSTWPEGSSFQSRSDASQSARQEDSSFHTRNDHERFHSAHTLSGKDESRKESANWQSDYQAGKHLMRQKPSGSRLTAESASFRGVQSDASNQLLVASSMQQESRLASRRGEHQNVQTLGRAAEDIHTARSASTRQAAASSMQHESAGVGFLAESANLDTSRFESVAEDGTHESMNAPPAFVTLARRQGEHQSTLLVGKAAMPSHKTAAHSALQASAGNQFRDESTNLQGLRFESTMQEGTSESTTASRAVREAKIASAKLTSHKSEQNSVQLMGQASTSSRQAGRLEVVTSKTEQESAGSVMQSVSPGRASQAKTSRLHSAGTSTSLQTTTATVSHSTGSSPHSAISGRPVSHRVVTALASPATLDPIDESASDDHVNP